jgi:hypothetical protein
VTGKVVPSLVVLIVAASAGSVLLANRRSPDVGPGNVSNVAAPRVDPGVRFSPPALEVVTSAEESWFEASCSLPIEQLRRVKRGYFPRRSPDVLIVPREPNFVGFFTGQSHSGPWEYLQQVPLVFYGPGFIQPRGPLELEREVTLADLAPTLAELLGVPAPNAAGAPIMEVLEPEAARVSPPKLIVTVVWDGGGNNVLDAWPRAWPELASLMRKGSAVVGATVGSSPSVTPSIHTNIGTGTFPNRHGIVGIPIRIDGRVVISFQGVSPEEVITPTLADTYDRATGNVAKVGMLAYKAWHLGMIGHGSGLPGADRDTAVLVDQQENLFTNRALYSYPPELQDTPGFTRAVRVVDGEDGKVDSKWMGHDLGDPSLRRDTPVWVRYQTSLIKSLLRLESFGRDGVPDLFYTNYKQADEVGHNWNMLAAEMRPTLKHLDWSLVQLRKFLDEWVGKKQWVMVVTADHGQGPLAEAAGAWPILEGELAQDMARHFGVETEDLVEQASAAGFYLNQEVMTEENVTAEQISDWLVDYRLKDNVEQGESVPKQYENKLDHLIIDAAFPGASLSNVWKCAVGRKQP